MSTHDTPSAVGQPAKYDDLNETLLYSSPHLAEGPTHPGVDGRPGSPSDEPVTDRHGQELRPSRRREWTARDDAVYTGGARPGDAHYADVDAMDGQAAADRLDEDPGALLATSSGAAGAYRHGALVAACDEELPTVPPPFPADGAPEGEADDQTPPAAGAYARERFPLATEERIEGEHAELLRQREKAHAAAAVGIDRADRCRTDVTAQLQTDPAATADRRPPPPDYESGGPDPREELAQAELAAVNRGAARLAEALPGSRSTAALAEHIAGKVVEGTAVPEAIFAVRDARRRPPSIQSIDSVGPWAYEVNIQGTVEVLWEPKDVSQKQVGLVADDTGTAKVTIWQKSGHKPLLHEGDVVRIRFGKPGRYNGRPTVAVTADTFVNVLDRGDGPAPTRITARSWDNATDFSGEQRFGACTLPAPGEGEVVSRPTHVPEDRRSLPVEQPDAVTKDKVGKGSLTAGAWLKTDVVYPAVAVIPRFSKEDVRRRRAARASDDPTERGAASNYEPIGHSVVRIPFPDWWTEQDAVTEASSTPTGGWFDDADLDDGECPVTHCDFDGATATALLDHIGETVEHFPAGPHAQVQLALEERGMADADGASHFGLQPPEADAPLADRQAFPPRPGAAYRLSRSFDSDDDAVADDTATQAGADTGSSPTGISTAESAAPRPVAAANGGEAITGPTTTARCPECGHERAAYQLKQTRAADEAPTRLYRCLTCSHRWRDDD